MRGKTKIPYLNGRTQINTETGYSSPFKLWGCGRYTKKISRITVNMTAHSAQCTSKFVNFRNDKRHPWMVFCSNYWCALLLIVIRANLLTYLVNCSTCFRYKLVALNLLAFCLAAPCLIIRIASEVEFTRPASFRTLAIGRPASNSNSAFTTLGSSVVNESLAQLLQHRLLIVETSNDLFSQ